tara:strand:- start:787 stop:984 length:198 start_codon:yes stop_codon:yes gene_type:complete
MQLKDISKLNCLIKTSTKSGTTNEEIFTKDYVKYLDEAVWRLERKLPSNGTNYSDLLENTEWSYK